MSEICFKVSVGHVRERRELLFDREGHVRNISKLVRGVRVVELERKHGVEHLLLCPAIARECVCSLQAGHKGGGDGGVCGAVSRKRLQCAGVECPFLQHLRWSFDEISLCV